MRLRRSVFLSFLALHFLLTCFVFGGWSDGSEDNNPQLREFRESRRRYEEAYAKFVAPRPKPSYSSNNDDINEKSPVKESDSKSEGLSTSAIIAISLGVGILLLLLAASIVFCICRRKSKNREKEVYATQPDLIVHKPSANKDQHYNEVPSSARKKGQCYDEYWTAKGFQVPKEKKNVNEKQQSNLDKSAKSSQESTKSQIKDQDKSKASMKDQKKVGKTPELALT